MSNFTPIITGAKADADIINDPMTELDGAIGDLSQVDPDIADPATNVVECLNALQLNGAFRGFRTETTDFTTAILKNPGDYGFQAFKNELQMNVGNGGIIVAFAKSRTVSTP
ncbi:MAG: hypothetical protein KC441_01555 [Anaerolineales bacterium]|nr:hypothetical protein [Anaerolineales bacterium]